MWAIDYAEKVKLKLSVHKEKTFKSLWQMDDTSILEFKVIWYPLLDQEAERCPASRLQPAIQPPAFLPFVQQVPAAK